jgi:3-oxoacyl-[acyl-carrier protein] reductase
MAVLAEARILIAGGTGNLGRHLVDAVLAAGGTAIVPTRSAEKLEAFARDRDAAHPGRLELLLGDIADEQEAEDLLERALPIQGVVASFGGFVAAPRVLAAPRSDLQRVFEAYVAAHFAVARLLIPALELQGGGYVTINGPLAFEPLFPGTGLVSVATAAQAMLARVLMKELAGSRVRVNEVVIYSSFGRGDDDKNVVTGADIGRYVAYLLSARGAGVCGQTIHLRSREQVAAVG